MPRSIEDGGVPAGVGSMSPVGTEAAGGGRRSPPDGDDLASGQGTGERAVVERLRARFRATGRPESVEVGIGDDAAVVTVGGRGGGGRAGGGAATQVVLATDFVVEGVHVDLSVSGLDDAGAKALAVTFSDLAAMGARPAHALVSIGAPVGTDLDLVADGIASVAERAGCAVVGGDLSSAPVLVLSTSVVGELQGAHDDHGGDGGPGPLLRSGARPGDRLLVTGALGRSEAGRRVLQRPVSRQSAVDSLTADLVAGHRRPIARLDEGETARLSGASAAIDVSDGLATDLRHLAAASNVGVELDDVPVAEGATLDDALGGGEDYELVIATPDPERLVDAFLGAGLTSPITIGTCTERPGILLYGGRPLPEGGWQHRF